MLRRKLFINLVVILICGTIAVSLPIITHCLQHPAAADTSHDNWELVSICVNQRYQNLNDNCDVWQIEQRCGDQVIATWDEIYAAIQINPEIVTYNSAEIRKTHYGFAYKTKTTAAAVVTYQGKSCTLG